MRIAIIGGRNFNDYELIDKTLEPYLNRIRCVVSGGAIGADSLGERWAKNNNVDTLIFLPDWKKYGKSAGYIRNKDIVSNSDIILLQMIVRLSNILQHHHQVLVLLSVLQHSNYLLQELM